MKDFNKLTFSDNFMFTKILYDDLEITKEILEMLTNRKLENLSPVEKEKSIDVQFDAKGIRLDIYVEDRDLSVYNAEMQTENLPDLPKRARYYHALITLHMLKKGDDYESLREAFVIFILKNGLGKDYPKAIYEYEYREKDPEGKSLHDGTHILFINAATKDKNIPQSLKEFLHYVHSGEIMNRENSLTRRLEARVEAEKIDPRRRQEYMLVSELVEMGRKEGHEEGLKTALAQLMQNTHCSLSDACKMLGLREDTYKDLKK